MARDSSSKSGGHPRKPVAAPQGARRPSLLTVREGRAGALAVAGLAAVIALIPGNAGPPTLIGWDKLDHAAAFAAITLLARCGWPSVARIGLAAAVFAYGIGIELAQSAAPVGRVASVSDVAANAAGIGLGLAISWAFGRIGDAAPYLDRRR
ncbi:MAG: VanZ family protein [Oceanicaulis sp.]